MNGNVGCARAWVREASCCFVGAAFCFSFEEVVVLEDLVIPLGLEVDFRDEVGLDRFGFEEIARRFLPIVENGGEVILWCGFNVVVSCLGERIRVLGVVQLAEL